MQCRSMLWFSYQDLAERLSTVQMSAAIPEVPGARLGTLGRCLQGKRVKFIPPRVLHRPDQCSLTLKGATQPCTNVAFLLLLSVPSAQQATFGL